VLSEGDYHYRQDSQGLKSEDSIEGGLMKLISVCLSLTILLTGCYSYTSVTKDTPVLPPTTEVTFRLTNGTQIVSSEYHRIENGYHIMGKWNGAAFEGSISDDKISQVVFAEFDSGKTTAIVAGVVIVVALIAVSVSAKQGWTNRK
jgi:hypothetical protein